MGSEPPTTLATPVEIREGDCCPKPGSRGDVEALRAQGEAARQGVVAAQGSFKPESVSR